MLATKKNFERYINDSYPIKLSLFKSEDNALDITGCTFNLKIQNALGTSIEKTITGSITNALSGSVQFAFTQLTFNEAGSFKYEIEMLTSEEVKYTIATGIIKIVQDLG